MNRIDPIEQVFMDFYAYLHEPNPEGKTELVDYGFWAKKIRILQLIEGKNESETFERIIRELNGYPSRCAECGKPSQSLMLGDAYRLNALGGRCFECVGKHGNTTNA